MARTASLPDLRRWPGVGFLDKVAKSEFRPRWESEVGIPTSGCAARQAGGFDARQRLRYLAGTWRVPEVPGRCSALGSSGRGPDWSIPQISAVDPLGGLRKSILSFLADRRFPKRLLAHVSSGHDCPIFAHEVQINAALLSIDAHQPYCLHALHALSQVIQDPDTSLFMSFLGS